MLLFIYSPNRERKYVKLRLIGSGVVHGAGSVAGPGRALTSVQGPQAELSVPVQLLQTRRPSAGMEYVVLLVPWSLIVEGQLALYVQVGHRWEDTDTQADQVKSPQLIHGKPNELFLHTIKLLLGLQWSRNNCANCTECSNVTCTK